MRSRSRSKSPVAYILFSCLLITGVPATLAQSQSKAAEPGVIADDELTLVIGTRFVTRSAEETSPKAQFTDARIPLSKFNETDRCVDEGALEVAREYFNTLGRTLGKAAYFYVVPEDEVRKSVSMCEKLHKLSPQAWVDGTTTIIAFGKVVPTMEAPALEQSIR
jgi:hypothetical protein